LYDLEILIEILFTVVSKYKIGFMLGQKDAETVNLLI